MTDELSRLIDLPAAARLQAAGGELQLITLTHEHADKVSIERRRLPGSIDLADLLQLIGAHGLAQLPASQIQVTEVAAPQLPAPTPEPGATAGYRCPECGEICETPQGLGSHRRVHRAKPAPAATPVPAGHLVCADCGRSFARSQDLGSHRWRTHGVKGTSKDAKESAAAPAVSASPAPSPDLPAPAPLTATDRRPFACADCGAAFRSQKALDAHSDLVHWERVEAARAAAPAPVRIVQTEGICDVCRHAVDGHERCADCGALTGKDHAAGAVHSVINGHPFCATCVDYRRNGRKVKTT